MQLTTTSKGKNMSVERMSALKDQEVKKGSALFKAYEDKDKMLKMIIEPLADKV